MAMTPRRRATCGATISATLNSRDCRFAARAAFQSRRADRTARRYRGRAPFRCEARGRCGCGARWRPRRPYVRGPCKILAGGDAGVLERDENIADRAVLVRLRKRRPRARRLHASDRFRSRARRTQSITGRAAERGVFGAPMFFVGAEMFWGKDRLDFVERWLTRPVD